MQLLTITTLKKHEEGRWHSNSLESLPDNISDDAVVWIDAQDLSEEEMKTLNKHFELDELNLEELTRKGRRSKIEEHQDRVSCFVSFPKQEGFVSEAKMDWIAFVVGKRWIITVHEGYSDLTCSVHKQISTHGYFALSLSPSTDILLYIFLDLIANEFFVVSDLVHERLQNLSNEAGRLFREKPKQVSTNFGLEISKSRDQVLAMRQSIGPLREIVGRIIRGEFALVSRDTLFRFEDLYDRAVSLIDVVDTHREEIHDIGDILINVQTLTTNNIIRVLTIISAIFLPLTLIAGIYGTNFGRGFFIPGSNIDYGFYLMILIMVGVAVGLIAIFRGKGWL
jgi:magnesium transporter